MSEITGLNSVPESKAVTAGTIRASQQSSDSHHRGRRAVQLIIDTLGPDHESLVTAAKDWLVPLLIEQFFAERGLELPQSSNRGKSFPSNYRMPVQGAREQNRVNTSL